MNIPPSKASIFDPPPESAARCDFCNGTSDQWGWLPDKRRGMALVCRNCCEARGHFFWGATQRGFRDLFNWVRQHRAAVERSLEQEAHSEAMTALAERLRDTQRIAR